MKTGRKSSAELATSPAYVRPFGRLQPPTDLSEAGRQLFLNLVLGCEPNHFRSSDMPLVTAFVRAALQEQAASAHLEAEGHVIDGKPSPWLAVLGQSQKALVALSHRLRLSPQGRSPTNPKRPQSVSYYERMAMERAAEGVEVLPRPRWGKS
jgi:phage terminase small subunit